MTTSQEITAWIDGVRAGDSLAAERLWSAYFEKLTRFAASQLAGAKRAVRDEEDVALSALKSFCLAAREGRFEQLVSRENLWPLLVSITAHKSVDAIRHENRKKRGGTGKADSPTPQALVQATENADVFLDSSPTPEFAAELSEQFQILLTRLDATGDAQLRQVAVARMSGETIGELAKRLDCSRRTIERKMSIVRHLLSEQLCDDSAAPEIPG